LRAEGPLYSPAAPRMSVSVAIRQLAQAFVGSLWLSPRPLLPQDDRVETRHTNEAAPPFAVFERLSATADRSVDNPETHVAGQRAAGSRDHHRACGRATRDDGCHVRIADYGELSGSDAVEGDSSCAGQPLP